MTPSIQTLHAMAGRFVSSPEPLAFEASAYHRHVALVRQFQRHELDPEGLCAALRAERVGTAPSSAATGVAVIGLTGVLMPSPSIFSMLGFGTSMIDFTHQLTAAQQDRSVKAIVVLVDSPGGSVRGVMEAAAAMRIARERKPVIAAVAGMAASAAYWICSNATIIEATPSASVGAIGIITERVSVEKQLAQDGVTVNVISAGKYKAEGHPATAMSDAERKALQSKVDAAYVTFVDDIALGRHVAQASVRSGFGEGRTVSAPDALRLGMIDRVATVDDTIARVVHSPAALTAMYTQRVDQARTTSERARLDQARAEIATHRQRIQAVVDRSAHLR